MRNLHPITETEANAVTAHAVRREQDRHLSLKGYCWTEWTCSDGLGLRTIVQIERNGERLGTYELR